MDSKFDEPDGQDSTCGLQLTDGAEGEPYADDYFDADDNFDEDGENSGNLDDTDDEARAHELQREGLVESRQRARAK